MITLNAERVAIEEVLTQTSCLKTWAHSVQCALVVYAMSATFLEWLGLESSVILGCQFLKELARTWT